MILGVIMQFQSTLEKHHLLLMLQLTSTTVLMGAPKQWKWTLSGLSQGQEGQEGQYQILVMSHHFRHFPLPSSQFHIELPLHVGP